MANLEKLKKKLQNSLKLCGFNVRREFCSFLVEKFLDANVDLTSNTQFEETIKNISSILENQCSSGHSVEKEHIDQALEVCLRSGYNQNETICNVINAFDFPKLYFNQDRKIYLLDENKGKLLSGADVKAKLFIDRYCKVRQRTKRAFAQTMLKDEKHQLTLQTVDFLLTVSDATLDRTLILGALLQVSDGKFALEDLTGTIQLDLSHTKYHPGFYTEGSIVLVNGYYEDKMLHVSTMIMPTGEDYSTSRLSFGNLNYFGGPSTVPLKDSQRLQKYLSNDDKGMFVFISDLWLDHCQTFLKLEKLFDQMQSFVPPIAFVFLGNFTSESHGSDTLYEMKKQFKRLGELIAKYPLLVSSSQFIFVPGMDDPCTPHIVPRFALPNIVTQELKRAIPKAIFATNPCRFQYCTKEIVIFRADLLSKFLQRTLHQPHKEDIPKYITKTIIGQGHLCPLSLNDINVHWELDYCMSLYPLPDLIVIGDKCAAYKDNYKGCIVVNPGQFCTGDFGFKMYFPNNNIEEAIEDCAIDIAESDVNT
ncbi:hypothetical protein ABEB36_015378 [Hypothenemus hampei]|uniref:DNA polymerase epsilon subunit n=1 Tax=Hypothenemus hampei TaxID=57062 RepID=A0ABD1E2R5_HYPHA